MKTLDKYIYKSLIIPSIFGISIFTFILMLNVLIRVMERLFTSDLGIVSIIDYFFYMTPSILVQTMPMGTFLGVMLAYGNMSEYNEIVAMEGNGISLFRITKPAIIFGMILMFLGIALELFVNPVALEKINLQTKALIMSRPSSLTEEKVFLVNSDKGFGFYINEVDNNDSVAKNLLIFNRNGNNPYPVIFLAEEAKFESGNIDMQNVSGISFDKSGNAQVLANYDRQTIPITTFLNSDEENSDTYTKSRSEMNIDELIEYYNTNINNESTHQNALKAMVEVYQRLIGPIASVLLCWLGVLLSVNTNKRNGRGISFGISLLVIFGYIGLANYAKIMILKQGYPVHLTMWLSNAVLLIMCIYFSIKKYRRN